MIYHVSIKTIIMKTINKTYKMKTKQIMLMLLLVVTPLISFSQSIFEKYEDLDDVTTVVVTKSAFRLMSKIGGDSKEAKEYINNVKTLDNLAIYTTSNIGLAEKMKADVKKHIKKENLSELFRVKDKKGNVKIYVREGRDDDHVKELFMFIENINNVKIKGEETQAVIVSLRGDIELKKVGGIIDKMNVPGGEHLKHATKK